MGDDFRTFEQSAEWNDSQGGGLTKFMEYQLVVKHLISYFCI